jgi:Nif-specific regulatory protein
MEAQLVLLNGDQAGLVIPLAQGGRVTLGRHRTNQVVLEEDQVSRYHAEIVQEKDQWVVRDHASVNGTFVDGQKIRACTLEEGQIVRIGPVQMRFTVNGGDPAKATPNDHRATQAHGTLTSSLLDATPFQVDEFNALCRFMADAVETEDPRAVIRLALKTVQEVTQADVVGFLGLDDAGELLPRIVLPERARDEYHLSKGLTARARASRKPIWLQAQQAEPALESLSGFEDAVCVPLGGPEHLLGALHAYQRGRSFREHDVRLCEIVARHLAGSLRLSRLLAQLEEENSRLRLIAPPLPTELIGDSPVMVQLRDRIRLAARHLTTVLIRGETGVGKELVATALHRLSNRAAGPLVIVNCGGLKRDFLESMLYGHRRRAFTDAEFHRGFLFRADGGVLFLDEIGELPDDGQAHFLRILEGKSFTPLGSDEDVRVDVKFLAATNRNLEEAVQQGRFREDLFFRLQRIQILVPPLREHLEDIPQLARHYFGHKEQETGRTLRLTADAEARLMEYDWPGNVRQLWGVLDNAMAFLEGDEIDAAHLQFGAPRSPSSSSLPTLNVADLKKLAIEQALAKAGGNVTDAAEMLKMARSTLVAWLGKNHGDDA